MLKRLAIENIAIIDAIELTPQKNLVVLTGETGSGKSLLLDAIELLFSKRLKAQGFLNKKQDKGRIELDFDLSNHPEKDKISKALDEQGIETSLTDEWLNLSREISPSSSRVRINGTVVTLELMLQLAPYLVEIYGQHDLHQLFSASKQRQLVDALGGEPTQSLKTQVKKLYHTWLEQQRQIESLKAQQAEREKALDFIQYQLNEINTALPIEPNEDNQLEAERNKQASIQTIQTTLGHCIELLSPSSDGEAAGINTQLGLLVKELQSIANVTPTLQETLEQAQSALVQVQEIKGQLQNQMDGTVLSEEELNQLIERLDVLGRLKRKYGGSLEKVLETQESLTQEHTQLNQLEENLETLETQVSKSYQEFIEATQALTLMRKKLVAPLKNQVEKHLKDLMLENARFDIAISPLDTPNETGADQVQLMFAANLGDNLKPIQNVASGGELARLMLAIQLCTAETSGQMLILDEVDAGLSGEALKALTEKLTLLSQKSQILYVTHHPLMAAKAIEHWHLSKAHDKENQKTSVQLQLLDDYDQRKQVLAVMTAGQHLNDEASDTFIGQLLANAQ